MRFGFAPTQSQSTFDAMRTQARLAESLGFEILWAHEHHSGGMMYPDPLMTLTALAPETERIGLGTNMLLLPIHHPVRVAQAAAMVDVLSDGRLHLGVANGYSPADLATFGVDHSRRGARLSAGIELIRALWTEDEVTRAGEDFQLEGFQLFPKPLQKPAPLIYVGGHARKAIERAARLGDRYLISTTQSMEAIADLVQTYYSSSDALERPRQKPFLNRIVCTVGSQREKAVALREYGDAFLSIYDSWGHESVTRLSDSDRAYDLLAQSVFIIGEPSECIEIIERYTELGIEHIACLMNFGGPDLELVERSMRLFGEQVIPHFASR